jgi:hypothetical protein
MNAFPDWFQPVLLMWSAVWAAVAVCRLPGDRERAAAGHFWRMSGLWAALNVAIVAWGLWSPPTDPEEARKLLVINGWLDLGYIVIGAGLVAWPSPITRGFGWAIIIQGAFLFGLDRLAQMAMG